MKEMQDPIDFLSTPQRGSRLSVRFRRFMDRVRALLSLPDVLDAWLSRLHGELDRRLDQSRAELKAELSTELGFSLHDFEAVLSEQKEGLMTVQNDLRSQLESVQNTLFETTNRLVNLDTSLHSRLNTLENERLLSITEDIHQLTALHFALRASMSERRSVRMPESGEQYQRSDPQPFGRDPGDRQ